MLGDPYLQSDGLIGKLAEIRKEVDGPRFVAVITITGKVTGPMGDTTVNAEVLFTFVGESSLKDFSTKPTFPPRPTLDIIESQGAITELRLAKLITGPMPGGNGRLRFQSNREVTLHRQIGLVAGAVPPPKLDKIPRRRRPTPGSSTSIPPVVTHSSTRKIFSFPHSRKQPPNRKPLSSSGPDLTGGICFRWNTSAKLSAPTTSSKN